MNIQRILDQYDERITLYKTLTTILCKPESEFTCSLHSRFINIKLYKILNKVYFSGVRILAICIFMSSINKTPK